MATENNTLQIDGTTKKFKEFATFNITTGEGQSLSLGFEELPGGNTNSYISATRDMLYDVAKLLLPEDAGQVQTDTKVAQLLASVKNTMSDRHVVNKCYNSQLSEWRSNFMPLFQDNLHELSVEQQDDIVRMNHLFCGIHVIANLGTTAKETMKEFENIASETIANHGFNRGNARSYDLLYESSKPFTEGHGCQSVGVAHFWGPYLEEKGEKNHFVNFHGERINIVFVAGGAAYYHRHHIADFLSNSCPRENRLLTSLVDMEDKLFVSVFRALGIVDKLITGPLFRLVEDKSKHIFALNKTWLHVIEAMEKFSTDASPLMEQCTVVMDTPIHKDDVYNELFKDSEDVELDTLTEDCLRILCCSFAILMKRQLQSQLPGGEHYIPSAKVRNETENAPNHNILTERDFVKLDAIITQKPNISTIARSGRVAFLTPTQRGIWPC